MDTVDTNGQMELNAIWTDEVKEKRKQFSYWKTYDWKTYDLHETRKWKYEIEQCGIWYN